ncbi:MAG: LptE family protein [Ignavibacteriaceae bacterium]
MIYSIHSVYRKSFKKAVFEVFLRSYIKPFAKTTFTLFIFLAVSNFTGCCIYSFTGASVPAHLNTIAIPIADDRSGAAEPGMRESFTEQLTQKFIDDNTLGVEDRVNANAVLETTITSLTDAPAIVTAGEQIQSRRITITVQAVYRDLVKRITIFEKSFSNYGEYMANASISERQEAIEEAVNKITDDILLETVSGW